MQEANVVPLAQARRPAEKPRKSGVNRNKDGSVRKINGKIYVDFMYLGERVRERSGLIWNEQNARLVREQLDKITVAMKSDTFRFAEVFPASKKAQYFAEKEISVLGIPKGPDQVVFKDGAQNWFNLLKDSGRVSGRTLHTYKGYLDHYLIPFFGDMTFAQLNRNVFERFISWARQRKLKGESVSNKSINKYFVPLKMISKQAVLEYQWGNSFDPFWGFKRLPEDDALEKIFPFSVDEQKRLRRELPEHWRPYLDFAFCSGLRPGEQLGIKPEDIDWEKKLLHVRRAITLDENGNQTEGTTKNRYSRRTIKLTPVMLEALETQKKIHDRFNCRYFFCSTAGCPVHQSNLRSRVWIPALRKAGLTFREMKQTRHTFVTIALSCGENPLWIAQVMGHRNTEMIIKVYSRYLENAGGSEDGAIFNNIYKGIKE
jgi:integrase